MLAKENKAILWEIFKALGVNGLTMTHYDLAKKTEITDADLWKQFLLEQDVKNYIQTEVEILRTTEFNKMIKNVEGVDGLKTGWTETAGYCLTCTKSQNGMRLISVVMNVKK